MSTLSNFDSTVNSFYLAFYGRPADPAGLKFWSQHLAASNGELGAITQAFATSEEAQVRFGADSVNERISEIYQQLFNRTIDADGLAYWAGVVEQGDASLADVSMAILKGARDTDATLSAMRQQAADDFTAQVEASSTQYSGYASIEAARVLVRAVTANATETDLAQLVKAAVSFADTATKNPKVVEAIAINTTLLALFDTARGKGDPVALAQALADTAKAAAGDPVTLESLLRGGGMDKVLKVMPAAASLKDVVKALAEGGLPAAVEVVYPTAPTAPSTPGSTAFKLSFDHVKESLQDAKKDNVTNVSLSDVTFKYSGNLAEGQRVQASVDGGDHWNHFKIKFDPVTRTVTVQDVHLGQMSYITSLASPNISIQAIAPQNVTTTVTLRVVDAEGKEVASFIPFKQDIIFDGYAATPGIKFATPVSENGLHLGPTQAAAAPSAVYEVEGIEKGAKVEYGTKMPVIDNGANVIVNPGTEWSTEKPVLKEGKITTFDIRQTDVAGNVSLIQTVNVILDTIKPVGTPTIALAQEDSGATPPNNDGESGSGGNVSNGDDTGGSAGSTGIAGNTNGLPVTSGPVTNTPTVTNPNTVNLTVSGLDTELDTGWEYSTDKGKSWIYGGTNDGSGSAPLSLEKQITGPVVVVVRQLDAAGNVSPQSMEYKIDAIEAPAFVVGDEHNILFISGSSTDSVLVDLTTDSYTRGNLQEVTYSQKFALVDATKYVGEVTVSGTVAEIIYAKEGFVVNGIDGYVIADTKAHIFSGAPGERVFTSEYIELLLNGADGVTLSDTLSIEEQGLFEGLADFDMDMLFADVDTQAPELPVMGLNVDNGIPGDRETTVGDVMVMALESDGSFQYRTSEQGQWMEGGKIVDGEAMITLTGAGLKYLGVKQFDAAGNDSEIAHFTFTLLLEQQSDPESDSAPAQGNGDEQPAQSDTPAEGDGGEAGIIGVAPADFNP